MTSYCTPGDAECNSSDKEKDAIENPKRLKSLRKLNLMFKLEYLFLLLQFAGKVCKKLGLTCNPTCTSLTALLLLLTSGETTADAENALTAEDVSGTCDTVSIYGIVLKAK